jgi:magnesium-transporting ATPase (P-type)
MEKEESKATAGNEAKQTTVRSLGKASLVVSIVLVSLSLAFAILSCYFYHQVKWNLSVAGAICLLVFFILFVLSVISSVYVLVGFFILSKKNGHSLVFPIVMTALAFCSIVGAFSDYFIENHIYDVTYSYSKEKWLEASPDDRYRIWPYFEKDHALIGTSRGAVLDYLGEPTEGEGTDEWGYCLGEANAVFTIDPYYLDISFSSDTVNMYSVVQR